MTNVIQTFPKGTGNNITVDSALSTTSENPVQNKVITNTLSSKADLVNGKVPSTQLPSYVDDVIEGYYKEADGKFYEESTYTTEIVGEQGKIYVSLDTNFEYRYGGSAFVRVNEGVVLGETSSTAYRGDRGKIAYDISQTVGDISNLQTTDKTSIVNAVNEVSHKTSIQVDTLPTAIAAELGNIYEYIGDHSIYTELTNSTSNFSGESTQNNWYIGINDLRLEAIISGYGMIKCKVPLTNHGTLRITHRGNTGAASYVGLYLGTTMGASDIYASPSWSTSTTVVTDEIDLSQFSNTTIYASFRINVSSGNTGKWFITSVLYDNPDTYEKGFFYECKSKTVSGTTIYYWDAIIGTKMEQEDMSEIITPLPSVMSRHMKYSTEEQIVGEWIDGKKIYQKTINLGALPNNTTKSVAHNISNFGTLIQLWGNTTVSSTYQHNIPYFEPFVSVSTDTTNVYVKTTANLSSSSAYITLQYTKTTD